MANCRKDTKAYENKVEYIKKYVKENYKYKNFTFNLRNEEDLKIMNFLDKQDSQSAFVKQLIKEYMIEKGEF